MKSPEEFEEMKAQLHKIHMLSPKKRRTYFSRKQQVALWEKGIAEAAWAINKRPDTVTEFSCGGHPRGATGKKSHTTTKSGLIITATIIRRPDPHIIGYVRTREEYGILRTTAKKSGLVLNQLSRRRKEVIRFELRTRRQRRQPLVEKQKRFKRFAKELRKRTTT